MTAQQTQTGRSVLPSWAVDVLREATYEGPRIFDINWYLNRLELHPYQTGWACWLDEDTKSAAIIEAGGSNFEGESVGYYDVVLMGGTLKGAHKLHDFLVEKAKQSGVKYITCAGRLGWSKVFDNVKSRTMLWSEVNV